jgi:LacI family transcriptional regulator
MARPLKVGSTIGEVAAAAGVSRATVSRVMSGRTTVAPDIAARVQAAADKLQYRPSNVARSLSLGRTNTVALVVPDLANPMFQQVLRGAMAAAAESGYRILVAETVEDPAEEAELALEARMRCDALILAAPRMPESELRALLPRVEPAVVLNRSVPGAPALAVDYAHGISVLVDHLVDHGHRDLAYVAGPPSAVSHHVRAQALQDAAARHQSLRVRTIAGGSTVDDGYRVAEEVLDSRATGVLAFNDLVAFGLLARLNETGVAVPGDISVAGFDDIELARYSTPSLTTASVPQAELGRRAWVRLAEVMSARTSGTEAVIQAEVIEPRLVVRTSTGPVPPARRLAAPSSNVGGAIHRAVGEGAAARWRLAEGGGAVLEGFDVPLTRYELGTGMPRVHSPRPYLHPVHSLAGRPVTVVSPVDHRHHYGASMAVADVDGTSYWGGRTFLRGQGPTLLSNHGRQLSTGLRASEDGAVLVDSLTWADQNERRQVLERRELTGVIIPEGEAWALGWHSELTAPAGAVVASPAVKGRPGAGYGGIFWRLPFADVVEVLSESGTSEAEAHGSTSRWVSLAGRYGEEWTTVLLVQDATPVLPWFVRVADYVGVGPALAWDEPLRLAPGETLPASLVALIVDRRVTRDDASDLADLALARVVSARGRS